MLALVGLTPLSLHGQYRIVAPSHDTLVFSEEGVRGMLERTRRARKILEEDPRVLYRVSYRLDVSPGDSSAAYPWNAVRVRSDSVAEVHVPGDYREGDRAYFSYAVAKMGAVRSRAPASDCETVLEQRRRTVATFADGWIVARVLFGAPLFRPLDALAFAREAGHLVPMLVALGGGEAQGCAEEWRRAHPERMEALHRWLREDFYGEASSGEGAEEGGDGLTAGRPT